MGEGLFKVTVVIIDFFFSLSLSFNFLLTLSGVVKTACAAPFSGLLLNTSVLHCCSFLFQSAHPDCFLLSGFLYVRV